MGPALPYYVALGAGILFGILGQIALKYGAIGGAGLRQQFLAPATIAGFAIYALAACLYAVAIKRIPLSLAYPSVSVSYLVVAWLAHLLWNEPFGVPQIAGMVLITGGILLLYQ